MYDQIAHIWYAYLTLILFISSLHWSILTITYNLKMQIWPINPTGHSCESKEIKTKNKKINIVKREENKRE